ncbi:MAG: PAS domain S-box protein [Syntrophales bacterium]
MLERHETFGTSAYLSLVNWLSRTAQWLGGVYLLFAALAALHESQLPLLPSQEQSIPAYYRDAVAVAMVLTAAAIRMAFLSAMGMRAPFVTFYPAVIFASIYGGLRAGLLATALSAIVVDYFWIEPVGQFYIEQTSDWLAIMTFLLTGAMIAGVSDAMHRARVSASAAEKQALLAAERAEAAETLYETRAKLEAALESMSDAVFISDTDGNFIDFNEAFATFHKLRNKDECAKTFAEYPDILDVFMADGTLAPLDMWAVPRALRGETGTNVEYTLRRKDTGETWVGSYSFGPIRDKDGMIVGSVVVGRDVTERKRAEEAVSRSQKTLFELVERSPFGIYIVDSQFRITLMNTGSQNGAFRNVRPVIGRPFDEAMRILWPEDVAVEIIAHFRHTLDTGEPYYSRKFINPRHDEKIVESYEWELHRMTLPDGQYGVICYYFDSTILRQAEEALRQSEARWNAAIENFGEGAIIATEDEQVIYWNPAARAMHGFTSAEEGIGPLRETPITFQLWTPDGQDLLELDEWPMRRIKRGETVRHLELCLRRPDQGWEKIVSYSGAMVETASGERLIFLSVYDLTELRKAEEALKTALQRLNALVAGMQSSLLLVGEGRIEMANQAFCDYFGLEDTPGDLVGLTPRQMIDKIKNAYLHPEEQVKRIWEIARGGQPVIGEEMSMRDGRTSLRDFIPIYADGKSYGLLWHHIDITERKQAEEVLRERTQKLEEANKELESFAYSVSHDLRAPLRAIDGYARMILKKEGGRFDEDTTRKFNDIRSNAQMMGKLIDDILTLSRLGRAKMSMVDLEMEGIINDIWKEQQTINPERNMGLTVEAMPYGYGDRTLIKQVYANLIGNAVKFTKYKNPAQIKAGGYTKGNENIYYVKDNGVGFDMAYYDKLFGIFQRLHNNPDFEGTGVGLATIQRAVHRHGGRVWAEGKVNEGATFYFSLPS